MPNESSARALVVTVSDRAARGEYADRSGPILVAGLGERRCGGEAGGERQIRDFHETILPEHYLIIWASDRQ